MIIDDGVFGTESGAIVLCLARKSGKLMPCTVVSEAQVLEVERRRAEYSRGSVLATHVISGGTGTSLVQPHANVLAYQERGANRPARKIATTRPDKIG
jgi:hypothetical protein